MVRLRVELQRTRETERGGSAFAVHVTNEHGQQQHQHRQHNAKRPTSISTDTHSQQQHPHQRINDYSPAFSDDLGPVSLPSSQTNSPRPTATSSTSAAVEQLQAENESLHAAIDTMRHEMNRVVSEVETRVGHDKQEVERLRRECERVVSEREEWRVERERLLDISNRLKAELRRQQAAVSMNDEKQQQVEEHVESGAMDWSVKREGTHSTVGDIDRVRQALNGLIHSNQQLSDNIKALSAAPLHPTTTPVPPPPPSPHPPASSQSLPRPHSPSTAAASVSNSLSPRSRAPIAKPVAAAVSTTSDKSAPTTTAVASILPRPVSPAASRFAHRRSSGLRRLQTAELALTSAAALTAEVERLSPRAEDESAHLSATSPTRATRAASTSPSRPALQLNGKRAALIDRDGERREAGAGRGGSTVSGVGQTSGSGKRDKAALSSLRSRMNLTGKVRNYAAGT